MELAVLLWIGLTIGFKLEGSIKSLGGRGRLTKNYDD